MPRADPARSPYCASRHLLRNLDDACALRRNPLAQPYFAAAGALRRGDFAADRQALESLRGAVQLALARCREQAAERGHVGVGRICAALLRCELDNAAPAVVAAELGLSERQLRRERRAAHDAFLHAFERVAATPRAPASAVDLAALRLAHAVELHECGQSALALAACEAMAAAAPLPERRIEALCLAAEAELDAARFEACAQRLAEADAILALRRRELAAGVVSTAREQIDFVAWSLRRHTGAAGGFAMEPPLVVARAGAALDPDEARRALLVRALAAYAMQRWETGDVEHGRDAIRRAQAVLGSLDPSRAKERFALMHADVMLAVLRLPPLNGRAGLLAVEQLAARSGHARRLLPVRAERIGSEVPVLRRPDGICELLLGMFGAAERRTMSLSFATAARLVAQYEADPLRGTDAALLAERFAAPRSAEAMLARCRRAVFALHLGRYDEARALACAIRTGAQELGNGRLHGAAARHLARIALGQHRVREAQRHVREALPLLERYGSYESLREANEIARRLGVN
ncbi:MAG: hypothetical protein JO083_09235 [Candidatus Eremiobacteraeota bacterium]|nr:hypothetical protein [Candidatus Eremiobacteraeota bacterium]